MSTLRLARHAMATRFELVLHGENPVSLRSAGEEALDEIDRLEAQLSLFRPTSEIAHLNARAAREPVRVTPPVFALLQHALKLSEETNGAFDITIAPLVRCWGFLDGSGHLPSQEELAEARAIIGMHLVQLFPETFTVRFAREGVMLDLGAIGKGYAIERAAELLREAGVRSALLHGGTSTVYALGHPPEEAAWQVAIASPARHRSAGVTPPEPTLGEPPPELENKASGPPSVPGNLAGDSAGPLSPLTEGPKMMANRSERSLAIVSLTDEALSVSAVWGKFFESGGRTFGHIIDPRTGQPATNAVLSAVVLPSATETDALSTALLTLGPARLDLIASLRPGSRTLVAAETAGELVVVAKGISSFKKDHGTTGQQDHRT